MKKVAIVFLVLLSQFSHAQTLGDLVAYEKEVKIHARQEVKESLQSLQDSLELTRKEIRIKRFRLEPCDQLLDYLGNDGLFADAATFLQENTCEGIYSFTHQTTDKGSYTQIRYFFDEHGNIVNIDTRFFLVIY